MKYRLLFVIILLTHFLSSAQFSEKTVSVVVLQDIKPLSYLDEIGQPSGLFCDLIEKIGERNDFKVRFVPHTWAQGLDAVKLGKVDLMPAVAWSEEREKFLNYCKTPVMVSWGILAIHNDSIMGELTDINGKKIGIMKGDQNARNFKTFVKDFNFECEFIEVNRHEEIIPLIEHGEVFGGVFFNTYNLRSDKVKQTSVVFGAVKSFFATANGTNGAILDKIDQQLDQWKNDKNSYYYSAMNKHLFSQLDSKFRVPRWILIVFGSTCTVVFLLILWVITLRLVVRNKTRDLGESEKRLRKLVENIRKSESNYLSIMESSLDTIMSIDSEYRLITANGVATAEFRKIFGIELHKGINLLQQVPEALKNIWKERFDRALAGERVYGEDTYEYGGSSYNAELRIFPIELDIIGCGAVVYSRDVTERKMSERELRKSETHLRTIIEQLADGITVTDERGMITIWNRSMEAISGISAVEMMGRPIWEVPLHQVDRARSSTLQGSILSRDEFAGFMESGNTPWAGQLLEREYERADGTRMYVEGRLYPIKTDSGFLLGCITRDISERKLEESIQAALLRLTSYAGMHSTQELIKQFLDETESLTRSKIGFYHYLEEDEQTISLQVWSNSTMAMGCAAQGSGTHYPVSSGGVWVDCIRERIPVIHNDYISLPGKRGLPEGHIPLIRELVVPVFRNEKIVAILGVGNKETPYGEFDLKAVQKLADVTWETIIRKRTEEDRERLMHAIEQAEENIMITNHEAIIQYVNPMFTRTTGYTREEIIGRTPSFLKSDEHDRRFYDTLWSTLTSGATWNGRFTNRKKDGTLFTEDAIISPVRDRTGTITNFVAVKRDVSKEVLLENRLRQSEKMEAIGQLAGGIAHDFNNILGAIMGFADMALLDIPKGSSLESYLNHILQGAERAKHLVAQILSFSRQSKEMKIPVFVHSIVKEAVELLRASLPSSIEIRPDLKKDLFPVLADPTKVHEIVMNLCTNAAHAMSEKGFLEIICEAKEIVAPVDGRIGPIKPGNYSVITVIDTGYGMDEKTLARIFEPFFTTKGPGKGTGMGLAVVFGIIQSHNGNITVESKVGAGTRFSVYLPETDKPVYADETNETRLQKGTEHILVVDDEIVLTEMVDRMLTSLGYRVTAFTDSVKALESFKANPGSFNLVITDQTMPVMTGIELSRELLKIRKDTPIILCTGFSKLVDESTALEAGIKAFVTKPLRQKELSLKIRSVLE